MGNDESRRWYEPSKVVWALISAICFVIGSFTAYAYSQVMDRYSECRADIEENTKDIRSLETILLRIEAKLDRIK